MNKYFYIDGSLAEKLDKDKLGLIKGDLSIKEIHQAKGKEKIKNKLALIFHSEEKELTSGYDLEQFKFHLQNIHPHFQSSNRYMIEFSIFHKEIEEEKYFYSFYLNQLTDYKINKILDLADNYHIYCSLNTLIAPKRNKGNVFCSNAIVLDIDYYNKEYLKDLKPEQVIELMYQDDLFNDIEPSYFINSGNGFYIVYLLQNVPTYKMPNNVKLYEKISRILTDRFKDYGADTKVCDLARIFRPIGTINHKTGKRVEIIDFKETKEKPIVRYDLREFSDMLQDYTYDELQELREQARRKREEEANKKEQRREKQSNKKTNKEKSNTTYNFNFYTRAVAICEDLETIVSLRNGNVKGFRNYVIHLYVLHSFYQNNPFSQVENNTIRLNSKFIEPLTNSELQACLKSAEKSFNNFNEHYYINKGQVLRKDTNQAVFKKHNDQVYKYTNPKIIQLLNINDEEIKSLKHIITKNIKDERDIQKKKQQRRNGYGLTNREQSRVNRLFAVQRMLKRDLSREEMAKRLKISKNRVSELIKEAKNL